ncbi:MAG: methyltransferase domain-containing protein [Planctomycetota bacterium]
MADLLPRRLRYALRGLAHRGDARYCPVCEGSSARFHPWGEVTPRPDAICPRCGSVERHRLLWLHLKDTDLFDGSRKTVLHVAPERALEPIFRAHLGDAYLTADLSNPRAMVKMDVTKIAYPDASFDVIYCSHVLEHVPDDHAAMREFHRVLKPSGWAILLVPVTVAQTEEDLAITDPAERLRRYGQDDHVRRYGPDFKDRLEAAGFQVTVTRAADLADDAGRTRMGLTPAAGDIFHCTRER